MPASCQRSVRSRADSPLTEARTLAGERIGHRCEVRGLSRASDATHYSSSQSMNLEPTARLLDHSHALRVPATRSNERSLSRAELTGCRFDLAARRTELDARTVEFPARRAKLFARRAQRAPEALSACLDGTTIRRAVAPGLSNRAANHARRVALVGATRDQAAGACDAIKHASQLTELGERTTRLAVAPSCYGLILDHTRCGARPAVASRQLAAPARRPCVIADATCRFAYGSGRTRERTFHGHRGELNRVRESAFQSLHETDRLVETTCHTAEAAMLAARTHRRLD